MGTKTTKFEVYLKKSKKKRVSPRGLGSGGPSIHKVRFNDRLASPESYEKNSEVELHRNS